MENETWRSQSSLAAGQMQRRAEGLGRGVRSVGRYERDVMKVTNRAGDGDRADRKVTVNDGRSKERSEESQSTAWTRHRKSGWAMGAGIVQRNQCSEGRPAHDRSQDVLHPWHGGCMDRSENACP